MGEKGNGGHVTSTGTRAVRQVGLGGSEMTPPTQAASGGGGGGGLLDTLGNVGDASDIGGAAFGHREHGSDDD